MSRADDAVHDAVDREMAKHTTTPPAASVVSALPKELRQRVRSRDLTLEAALQILEDPGLDPRNEGGEGSDRAVRPQALEDVYRTVQSLRSEAAALGGIAVKLEGIARRLERDILATGEREVLAGRAIPEVLRTLTHDRTVYHYKDLFARLLAAGFDCSGHEPEATMLANISRSELWEKAGEPRSGEYQWAR